MTINIMQLIVIIIIAGLAWYANNSLNNVPVLRNVVNVLIVVISVLMLLNSVGLLGNSSTIQIR